MRNLQPALIILLLIASWLAVMFAISRISGWAALASRYAFDDAFSGHRLRMQSGSLRYWISFNNCLTLGADTQGLYLEMFRLFRLLNPNLFIPWSDIRVMHTSFLGIPMVELRLGQYPEIPLRLRKRVAGPLKSLAGPAWPVETVT